MSATTIALIQTASSDIRAANIEKTKGQIRQAASSGANIICLQELFQTPYFCQEESEENFALSESIHSQNILDFRDLAKELAIVLIVPFFEKTAPGVFFNSAAILDTDGQVLSIYRKMHIPHDPQFEEKYYFSPGSEGFSAVETKFGKIGVCICWDQWFPESARLTALAGAEIIFFPTAIGWIPEDASTERAQDQLDAWRTIQRSHAIANGCFVAAANRTGLERSPSGREIQFWGNSLITNPAGKVIAEAADSETIVTAEIDLSEIEIQRIQWPFLRDRRIDAYAGLQNRYGK